VRAEEKCYSIRKLHRRDRNLQISSKYPNWIPAQANITDSEVLISETVSRCVCHPDKVSVTMGSAEVHR
jgi:hypothetical protein